MTTTANDDGSGSKAGCYINLQFCIFNTSAVLPRFWDDHAGDLFPPFEKRRRRWQVPPPPIKNLEKYFSGNYHVKFGHFVNFSCTYFWAKSLTPSKVDPSLLIVSCPFLRYLRTRCLEVGPQVKSSHGSGEALWVFPAGSATEPQPKWNFVNFSLKI